MTASVAPRITAKPELVVMDSEPGAFWFGAWRNINLLVWLQGATLDAVSRLDRTNLERTQAHPEKLTTVHIVTAIAGPPDPDARDAFNTMHLQWGHTVGCAAVVIERSGFVGVAVRSVITGMVLLAPKHYRVKVFDSIEPAAPWLVEQHARSTSVQTTETELRSVLRAARAAAK
ncbi:MAG TPA: hypothetical protein VFG30_37120 [Polyangiales bacterium]|nr:hypothetical protein [Polyangiales bacterium]